MKPSDLPNSNNQYLFNIKVVKRKGCKTGCMIDILVDNVVLIMELDTGASVSIISGESCSGTTFFSSSPVKLRTYTGKPLAILGKRMLCVKYEKLKCNLPLIMVAGTGQSLFDLNYL